MTETSAPAPWRLRLFPSGTGAVVASSARAVGLAALGRALLAPLPQGWRDAILAAGDTRVGRMFFLGFSSGLPLLLIFSTLSVWLREAGVDRSTVTMLSWAALAYSLKFVWAPLVDRLSLPVLTPWLGRRRGWMLLAQIALCLGLVWTGSFDPAISLTLTAIGAVMIGFSSATQDIVLDAYRIEAAEPDLQSMMSAMYIAGYRVGMLVAGAGSLWLAGFLEGDVGYDPTAWGWVYKVMALCVGIGILTTLIVPEPAPRTRDIATDPGRTSDQARFVAVVAFAGAGFLTTFLLVEDWVGGLSTQLQATLDLAPHLAGFLAETARFSLSLLGAAVLAGLLLTLGVASRQHVALTYMDPIRDFLNRYGKLAFLVLALIGTYRISDITMGAIANVFYVDMGFTKEQIAAYSKFWGLLAIIAGGFLGGVIALRVGVMRTLFLGGVLAAASNLLFALLAVHPGESLYLLIAIAGDNLSQGIASAAFVAYLSALTSIQFTAMQYALFSSLMTLFPKIMAGYGGAVVDAVGYVPFFVGTAVIGIPVLFLVALAAKFAPPRNS
ncbi:MAG: MFS transporter [Rhodospirillum sp.]|nr:MFS transporter [Rhodospirillum sp.]MCF8487897.1 MFS transporter [Rhodospirillum sp.]MCF8501449.1 MFS transporter [Rhodospirillum sp.]